VTVELPAISLRQPRAWMLFHMGKDIENRTRYMTHRGPTLIHAAVSMSADYYDDAYMFVVMKFGLEVAQRVPPPGQLQRGGIVGRVNVVDVILPNGKRHDVPARHAKADSPWYMGSFGYVLTEAEELPFAPCKGAILLPFYLDEAVLAGRPTPRGP
jgi:hypothetical protein